MKAKGLVGIPPPRTVIRWTASLRNLQPATASRSPPSAYGTGKCASHQIDGTTRGWFPAIRCSTSATSAARLHVARKERRHDEWNPPVEPYDPLWTGQRLRRHSPTTPSLRPTKSRVMLNPSRVMHVARKERRHDECDPPVEPYDPYGPGSYVVITDETAVDPGVRHPEPQTRLTESETRLTADEEWRNALRAPIPRRRPIACCREGQAAGRVGPADRAL